MVERKKSFKLGERQSERLKEKRCRQLGEPQSELLRVKRCKKLGEGQWKMVGVRRCRLYEEQQSSSSSSENGAAASKFISIVTDDLLLEIFLRLPDSRSVIQCGSVCKRWFYLISRSSDLYFIRKFNHHHRLKRRQQQQEDEELPYTLLMRGVYFTSGFGLHFFYELDLPCHNFLSPKSNILHHGQVRPSPSTISTTAGYLDFLHWPRGCILASFDDLLLMRIALQNFCICNPLTKQWVMLPKVTIRSRYGTRYRCGFVCKPNCSCDIQLGGGSYYCNCSIKYRVALISTDYFDSTMFTVAIFSSETGQWNESKFQFPHKIYFWHITSVGNNGVIYWGFGESELKGIVAFDPFKGDLEERCRLIHLPMEFGRGLVQGPSKKARLGVVRSHLRLSQFYLLKRSNSYVLKTWELDDQNESWDLVHHVRFKRSNKNVMLVLVALHPEDGDAFFLTCHDDKYQANDLFQYKIGSDDVDLVCRCTRSGYSVFSLVHPWWPTTIPSLPSLRRL